MCLRLGAARAAAVPARARVRTLLPTDISKAAVGYVKEHLGTLDTYPCGGRRRTIWKASRELSTSSSSTPCSISVASTWEGTAQRSSGVPGGHVFIGDVRNLPYGRRSMRRLKLSGPPRHGRDELRNGWRDDCHEQELLVSPDFFTRMAEQTPRLRVSEAQVGRGARDNELTRFRYDVVLIGGTVSAAGPHEELPWKRRQRRRAADISSSRRSAALAIWDVLNARVVTPRPMVCLPGSRRIAGDWWRSAIRKRRGGGAEEQRAAAYDLGYDAHREGARRLGGRRPLARAQRRPSGRPRLAAGAAGGGLVTCDERSAERRRRATRPRPRLPTERLPEYMLPSTIGTDSLPLTPSGKSTATACPILSGSPRAGVHLCRALNEVETISRQSGRTSSG